MDHWICEYWNEEKSRWTKVDAQLDKTHVENLDIDFDTCDVPESKFLFAGEAWELCRSGKESPSCFGIQDLNGLSFIKGNIIRDLFALRKVETLPWDMGWGILEGPLVPITGAKELALLDELAVISKASDEFQAENAIELDHVKLPNNWNWLQSHTIGQLVNGTGT